MATPQRTVAQDRRIAVRVRRLAQHAERLCPQQRAARRDLCEVARGRATLGGRAARRDGAIGVQGDGPGTLARLATMCPAAATSDQPPMMALELASSVRLVPSPTCVDTSATMASDRNSLGMVPRPCGISQCKHLRRKFIVGSRLVPLLSSPVLT